MQKNVLVKVVSSQIIDGQSDSVEINVHGILQIGEKSTKITYSEDLEEFGKEDSELIIENDSVLVIRKGAMNSEMLIRKGERNTTYYATPYGEFTIGIYGKEVSFTNDNDKYLLHLSYSLDFNNGFVSENILDIFIEEK